MTVALPLPTVQGYDLIRQVGSGGMADVYEGHHRVTSRRVAIKVMKTELLRKRGALERFLREIQSLGALHHESIVSILDAGESKEGLPFLVMEFIDGQPLREILKQHGPLSASRTCRLALQIARALAYAHAEGVVHRDLKPGNVMVVERADHSERVVLVDFGVSRRIENLDDLDLTITGNVLGTPHYMSPEQARGETDIDQKTDIYSLGTLIFELLSGEHAHEGENRQAVLHHVLYHRPKRLNRHATQDFPELSELLNRCLEKRSQDRPSSDEVVEVLETLRGARAETDSVFPRRPKSSLSLAYSALVAVTGLVVGLGVGWAGHEWSDARTSAEEQALDHEAIPAPRETTLPSLAVAPTLGESTSEAQEFTQSNNQERVPPVVPVPTPNVAPQAHREPTHKPSARRPRKPVHPSSVGPRPAPPSGRPTPGPKPTSPASATSHSSALPDSTGMPDEQATRAASVGHNSPSISRPLLNNPYSD